MKTILKIAINDLKNLFYSPVAWFLLILLVMQCAFYYSSSIIPIAEGLDEWKINDPIAAKTLGNITLTGGLFFGIGSIFKQMHQALLIILPLLTMGFISREINNGTIKLLYSSPVKMFQIVLGKYLALISYIVLMISVLLLFVIIGVFQIPFFDFGWIFSGLLAVFLLASAYAAIGLFMSSITNYQIISGVSCFVMLFALSNISLVWQQYDFFRDLTWFLSIAGRTEQMIAGLITSRDVIYFLVIICMFLSFTYLKLKGEKESKPWTVKATRYLVVVIIALGIGYISSRPKLVGYIDATAQNENTISPETQSLIKKMANDTLEITMYVNLLGPRMGIGLPAARNNYLYGLWDKYIRFKPDIKFKYVYYYDNDGRLDNKAIYQLNFNKSEEQIVGLVCKLNKLDSTMFMPPKEIRKLIDPYKEDLALFMTARYKGDTVNLRTYEDPDIWPNEKEIASKFKRLIEKKSPYVYFVSGNLERSIYKEGEREYFNHTINKKLRSSLVNLAYDVDSLYLETQDIPVNATALILADPKIALKPNTVAKINAYVAAGGNMMVLSEPKKQMMVNPILAQFGAQQLKGQLVQPSYHETPEKIFAYRTRAGFDMKMLNRKDREFESSFNRPDTLFKTKFAGVAPIALKSNGPFNLRPIYLTMPDERVSVDSANLSPYSRKTWLKTSAVVLDSVAPIFNSKEGDIKDSVFTIGVSATRKINNKEQKIFIAGDADMYSQLRFEYFLAPDIHYWLNDFQYPIYIPQKYYKDNILTLTGPTARALKTITLWVIPGLLLLGSLVLLIRRKRK